MGRRFASIALSAMLMLTLSSCLVVRAGGGLGGGGLGGGWNGGGWGGTGWRTTADRDDTIIYRCDDNRRFAARFEGDRAIVRAGDDRYQLQRSGPRRWRNGGGSVVLRAEGQRAELRVGDRDYRDCRGASNGSTTTMAGVAALPIGAMTTVGSGPLLLATAPWSRRATADTGWRGPGPTAGAAVMATCVWWPTARALNSG